jgi:hypothetical protein
MTALIVNIDVDDVEEAVRFYTTGSDERPPTQQSEQSQPPERLRPDPAQANTEVAPSTPNLTARGTRREQRARHV